MHVDPSILAAIKELTLSAQGALCVAQSHVQLAKMCTDKTEQAQQQGRADNNYRLASDHRDTAMVFIDSAITVMEQLKEVIDRAQAKRGVKIA